MDYKLLAKEKSAGSYTELELFAETLINFDLDFYDVDNIDKIKVPVNVALSLPKTNNNVALIDYDPSSSSYNTVPRNPFDFQLYVDNEKVLEGNMYVDSYAFNNSLPIINIRLVDRIQEIFKDLNDSVFSSMYSDYNTLTSFDFFLTNNSETVNVEPSKEDILFTYVDFCNDKERFDYAARQFIQFGPDSERVGFVPAYKVSSFIERFFNEANVGVTSRFFELGNYGSSIPNHNAEDLYMLLDTRLVAGSRTRTRGFYLVEGGYEHFINEYTGDQELSGNSTAKENDDYPAQSYGWNYAASPFNNPVDNSYGLSYQTDEPNDGENVDRAYFGSHMNYTASPTELDIYTGNARKLPTGSFIDLEIPLIDTGNGAYGMIKNIIAGSSTAKFGVVSTLWKDGVPFETFRMMNTDGTLKELEAVDASVVDLSNDSAENFLAYSDVDPQSGASGYPNWARIYTGPTAPRKELFSVLRFDDVQVGDFKWESKEIEIEAGSTYSTSISFEWLEGDLLCRTVETWQVHPTNIYDYMGWMIPDTQSSIQAFSKNTVTKAIFKADPSAIGNLYISFSSNGPSNPYFLDDDINVNWSQIYSDVSPFDTAKEILKRFNLSVVYDQNSSTVLIDRLPDIRSLNADIDITDKIDDRQEIIVDVTSRTSKSIEITTSNTGLLFDTFGYDKVILNEAGTDELKFDLKSRFYNDTLCGPEVIDEYDGGYLSDNEIGFTNNEFSKYTDVGITFGYVSEPLYTTNIKRGKFIDKSFYKGLVYETLDTHVFPRFIKDKFSSLPLYHFDENGDTTDLYDFFVGNDNVLYYDKPKVSLTALMDKEYAFNIKDNYSKVNISYINSNGIVIKSVAGQLFGEGIYGAIEGIIL